MLSIAWQRLNPMRKLLLTGWQTALHQPATWVPYHAGTRCSHHAKPQRKHIQHGEMMVVHPILLPAQWPNIHPVVLDSGWDFFLCLTDLSSSLEPRCAGTHLPCSFPVQELSTVGLQNKTKNQPGSSPGGHHLHLCWDFPLHSKESWTTVQKTDTDFCGHPGRAGPGLSLHFSLCPYARLLPHKHLVS